MRTTLISLALLTAAPWASAQMSKPWGNLQVTLESCFRASSGTDSGCNVILTNTSTQPVRVQLETGRDTVILPDSSAVKAKNVVFGGFEHAYNVTQVIPSGTTMRAQLNYNITKGVGALNSLRIGDAEFTNIPLGREVPDEPPVNLQRTAVTADESDQIRMSFIDCVRNKTLVTCSFVMGSRIDENLRVQTESYGSTWALSRTGLVHSGSQVTLGGLDNRYSVSSLLPARRALLSQVTFALPENDTYIPYLQLNNYTFRSLPITGSSGSRTLNPTSDTVDTYRLRDYAGKVNQCSYVREGLRCTFTLTNRTASAYRLTTSADDLRLLTPEGRWHGVTSMTAGGQTQRYSATVPLPAQQSGTLSVLYDVPAGLTTVPFISVGGLEFENVPVK